MFESLSQPISKNHFSKWLRHCPVCGTFLFGSGWLCHLCLKKLKSFYLEPQNMMRFQDRFRHIRLIDWNHQNDHFIRNVIKSLKGQQNHYFFFYLVREFLIRLHHIQDLSRDCPYALIPSPAKSKKTFLVEWLHLLNIKFLPNQKNSQVLDHGFFTAQAISDLTQFPVCPILEEFEEHQKQKQKSFLLRKNIKFKLNEKMDLPKNHNLIFVDDVVTTGSTAYAAYRALGRPHRFMIWSLFWREF